MGSAHPTIVPYQPFACADGYVMLAIGNDSQFTRFCQAAGRQDIAEDEKFARNAARVQHRAALLALLEPVMRLHTIDAWCQLAEQSSFPCGPINSIDRVFADPQVQARGMHVRMTSAAFGELALVGSPIRLSKTPVSYRHAPPALGADTEAVLQESGVSLAELAQLRKSKVI